MQFLPRVFSYHISSSTKHFVKVREKEKQYNPTHLKYGYKNSFPRLLLSPYNRDTQLHPIEIDYIHSSPHLPFYLDFLHNTDKKTPRDTKILLTTDTNLDMQIHLRCGHYNHQGKTLNFKELVCQIHNKKSYILCYWLQPTGKGLHVSRLQIVSEFNNSVLTRQCKMHINRQLLHQKAYTPST